MATAWRPVQTTIIAANTMTIAPPETMIQSRIRRSRKTDNRTDQCYPLRDQAKEGADLKVGPYSCMKRAGLVAILLVVAAVRADLQVGPQANHESDFLTRIRRLTVE